MYTIYLNDEDLLKNGQFPIIALINEAGNANIIEFVENLIHNTGSGYNYSTCSFWDDLDEYEQANTPHFDGVLVSNEAGEEIIVSFNDLCYYLEILYSRLSQNNYNRLSELKELIDDFRKMHC